MGSERLAWRRYGLTLFLVVVSCLILGTFLAIVSYLAANEWSSPGARGLLGLTVGGGYVGGIRGLGASTGALVALVIIDRVRGGRVVSAAITVSGAVVGGAAGAAVPWVVIVWGNISSGYTDGLTWLIPLGFASTVGAAALVGVAVAVRDARAGRAAG